MVLVPCRSLAFVAFRHANPYGGFLLCVASLLSCLVGHRSDPYRTLIRSISDTVPDQTGHPSDPIGKLSDISPDDCPTSIGTLSALNRNAVRLQIGLVSGLRRNTQNALEAILDVLDTRFGQVPDSVRERINSLDNERTLKDLLRRAILTPSLNEFQSTL